MRVPLEAYNNIRNEQGFLVLPKEFSCKDGKFKQIRRENDVAIYQRDYHFEVIKIQSQNPFEITKGIFTEKKENFPSSTTWGTLAYTCLDLKSAEKRFNELLQKKIESAPQLVDNQNNLIKRKRGRPRKLLRAILKVI